MLDAPVAVLDELSRLDVPFELIPCHPDYADTKAFCERYGFPPEKSANTIVVASRRPKGRHCACVLLATTRLDVNRTVCGLMGVSKASFASAERTEQLTGQTLGGVTVFGLPGGMPIYVDKRVTDCDFIILGAGSRSAKIKTTPAVLERMERAKTIEGLAF